MRSPVVCLLAVSVSVTHAQTRFERLADRDGFIVVYGNGLPIDFADQAWEFFKRHRKP